MKPSKKKSKKKKKPSPSPAAPAAAVLGSSLQPQTLAAAAAPSECDSNGGGSEASTSSASASFSTFSSSASTASSSSAYGDEPRDLAWLLDAFAAASIDQVESAYRDAGGDPFVAAGILGATVERQPPSPPPPPDLSPTPGSGGRKGGRRPKSGAKAATGMVCDVIGKDYALSAAKPANESKVGMGRDWKGGSGRRNSAEEDEQFLCSMLGDSSELSMGVVRDVLGQCGYNVEKALEALLDISGSPVQNMEKRFLDGDKNSMSHPYVFLVNGVSRKSSTTLNKRSSYQLTDETPNMAYRHNEKEHECLPYGVFDSSYLQNLPRSEITEGPCRSTLSPSQSAIVKRNMQQQILGSLFRVPEIPAYEPSTMDWKKVVKKLEPFNSSAVSSNQERPTNGKGDDYHKFRDIATGHYDKMKAYYQQAALAYARGERSYASCLAEEGKHYRDLARKEDEKASLQIFEARNKHITNTVTIDLHGQHVKQAIRLLKVHMLICVCMPSVLLRVITGCGLEGTGKGKIKRAVIELVEKEHIEWDEENSGTIVLRLGGPKEYSFTEHDSDFE